MSSNCFRWWIVLTTLKADVNKNGFDRNDTSTSNTSNIAVKAKKGLSQFGLKFSHTSELIKLQIPFKLVILHQSKLMLNQNYIRHNQHTVFT